MTPDSCISSQRSVPSRVRSPTPANTDTPPCCVATRLIISWISTVLPTPAPPNRPILPPCTYGSSRSMTLMPVSNINALGSSWSNGGESRWISHRSAMSVTSASVMSSGSPMTFHTWPRVPSPTGTVMPRPRLRTTAPRVRPSVGLRHTARTRPSPICCATSAVTTMDSPSSSIVISTAWLISGSESGGNSASTTGP